jgi:hypothetical protein
MYTLPPDHKDNNQPSSYKISLLLTASIVSIVQRYDARIQKDFNDLVYDVGLISFDVLRDHTANSLLTDENLSLNSKNIETVLTISGMLLFSYQFIYLYPEIRKALIDVIQASDDFKHIDPNKTEQILDEKYQRTLKISTKKCLDFFALSHRIHHLNMEYAALQLFVDVLLGFTNNYIFLFDDNKQYVKLLNLDKDEKIIWETYSELSEKE